MARRPSLRAGRSGGTAGFLLSETLATFLVSAFVLISLASVAQVLMHAIDTSVARVQDADGLGRTLASLARDVSGLSRARWSGDEPQPFVFRGGPNSLYFAHRETSATGAPELHVVALREVATATGPRLVRSEATLPATARSFEALRFVAPRPLDTGAARLRFSYIALPSPSQPGAARPVSSWTLGTQLPDAIIIDAIDASSRKTMVSTRVAIRATADIGCIPKGTQSPSGANPGAAPPATPTPVATSPVAAPTPGQVAPPPGPSSVAFCGRPDAKDEGAPPPPGAPL